MIEQFKDEKIYEKEIYLGAQISPLKTLGHFSTMNEGTETVDAKLGIRIQFVQDEATKILKTMSQL